MQALLASTNEPRRVSFAGTGPLSWAAGHVSSTLPIITIHADGLGSIVKTTNASGAVTSSLRYNAFGVLESGTPSPFGFTAREFDSETGLLYLRARYLDPRLGRFASEDPLRLLGDLNSYAYVGNSPLNWTDPSGLFWQRPPIPKPDLTVPPDSPEWLKCMASFSQWLQQNADPVNIFEQDPLFWAALLSTGRGTRGMGIKPSGSTGGMGAGREFTRATMNAARQQAGGNCVFCGYQAQPENFDHSIPIWRGRSMPPSQRGNNSPDNAQLTCQGCNQKKGSLTTKEFLMKLGWWPF